MSNHENFKRYIYPPTLEQINDFIKELNVHDLEFERIYGMAFKTISKVKQGDRHLPVRFWHVIFEKIKPSFKMVIEHKNISPKKVPIKLHRKDSISKLKKVNK